MEPLAAHGDGVAVRNGIGTEGPARVAKTGHNSADGAAGAESTVSFERRGGVPSFVATRNAAGVYRTALTRGIPVARLPTPSLARMPEGKAGEA